MELLAEAEPPEGTVVTAEVQTAGRGQFGRTWESAAGENLLFSVLLYPRFLLPRDHFLLSQAAALALVEVAEAAGAGPARVKWPNDLYLGPRKAAGILLQNQLGPGRISSSVIGIGLNVNQTRFGPALPNPTSLALATGRPHDREATLEAVLTALERRYLALKSGQADALRGDYHRVLYGRGEPRTFTRPDGRSFRGVIGGVEPDGRLRIETEAGAVNLFAPRELSYR